MTPPIVRRAQAFADRLALLGPEGTLTYRQLIADSGALAGTLLNATSDLDDARVAFLMPPGRAWVITQWAIWRAGGMAVPLAVSHPPAELAYVLDDAEPSFVIVDESLAPHIRRSAEERGIPVAPAPVPIGSPATPGAIPPARMLPEISEDRGALMIYTSGTTGRPKGVVTTHGNVAAQISSLVDAWRWSGGDRILLTLPLHHVHGIINVVSSALWSGACCQVHPGFDAIRVWNAFAEGRLTLYMAVPTIYARLIAAWELADEEDRERWSRGARGMRLMVSGSAALPVGILERWEEITGHRLLERYGMTEIGMGLGNPLDGPRRAGHVGVPFPGVDVRLVAEDGSEVQPGGSGEIRIRGPQVFREYWRRPVETAEAFEDGWFCTGDIAALEDGSYRILGRSSVDIIKTGGEKVSALEVEEALREHPDVKDCAVIGLPDPEWGEVVAAAIVPATEKMDAAHLEGWARGRLAPYKVPRRVIEVLALPVNAMGKVTKPAVRGLFLDGSQGSKASSAPEAESASFQTEDSIEQGTP